MIINVKFNVRMVLESSSYSYVVSNACDFGVKHKRQCTKQTFPFIEVT